MQLAVDPCVWSALQHIDEFLFGAFSVRIGSAPSWKQPLVMYADPEETEASTQRCADALELRIPGVMAVVIAFEVAPMTDEFRSSVHAHSSILPAQDTQEVASA